MGKTALSRCQPMQRRIRFLASVLTAGAVFGTPFDGNAQFAYQGMQQGIKYKVFIYAKESLGDGRWRFQTKAVHDNGSQPYYSDWRTADCENSTVDGEVVKAINPGGYQWGAVDLIYAVCGIKSRLRH
jgi:hypothetical protein